MADSEAVAAQRQLAESVRRLALAEAEREQLQARLQRLLAAVQSNANVSAEVDATRAWLAAWRGPVTADESAKRAGGTLAAAKIVEVHPPLRLAVLDVGAQQGVRIGMPFLVWRGDRVVAVLRVVEVRPQVCGALIERADPKVAVQAGDTVGVAGVVEKVPR